ncbi:MAG TPA: hypothetical protein VMQ51_11190, partial [Candidatus Binatia bacterium]|nr:hypothetical protein [Candidatus Binatia bacterium]
MRHPARLTLLGLIALVLLAAAPAIAETPAAPTVRIHGTETWTPVMELALDEVALLWTGPPRQDETPPAMVDGASVLRVNKDGAAVRLRDVTTVADLLVQARALRAANPAWETRLVLYAPGEKRSARSRRLLTEEIAVVAADGTVTREHAADPLTTLDVARSIGQRAEVKSAEAVAEPSDYLQARLKRKIAKLKRQDQPNERQEFFALKRRAPGEQDLPVERYLQAREHMRLMPLHSTAGGDVRHPSTSALGIDFPTAAAFLGSWTPLGPGNIGGRTRAIVVDPGTPTTMYAGGVAGGVWKTTNGGGTWTALTDTLLPNLAVSSLAMDPSNSSILYAGTGEGFFNADAVRGAGIFKSIDGGASWSQLATTANSNFFFVNKLVALSSTTLVAATKTGLWQSVDAGATWVQKMAASDCFDIAKTASAPYILGSCGQFTAGASAVYRSVDSGATWTPVLGAGSLTPDANIGRASVSIAPSDATIAYALTDSLAGGTYNLGLNAVYRSADSGLTWTATVRNTNPTFLNTMLLTNPIFAAPFSLAPCFGANQFFNQGWYDNVIAVDPADPNRVWAGGIDLFRSDDGGASWGLASFWWRGASPGAFAHADQHAIVFHPNYDGTTNTTVFVGNDGGIFKATNARAATTTSICGPPPNGPGPDTSVVWTELNNNYGVTQFYHGLPFPGADGGNTFFGGTQDNGTVLGTVAGGIDGWSTINSGDGGYVAVDSTNTNVLYAETTGLSISKSLNGGADGFPIDATSGITDSGFLFITPFTMSPNNSQILWIGGDRMWRTSNAAASWTQASQVFGCGSVSAIAVATNNGTLDGVGDNLVLAGTTGGCLFRTTAGLTSTGGWTQSAVPGIGFVSWIAFDPDDASIVYATSSTFTSNHVYKSIDGGATFTQIDGNGTTGLPDVPAHSIVIAPGNSSKLYVGTDLGVFSSDDGGATWAVENTGFANVITEALAVGQVGGVDHVFAFTHGRGVFRVQLPAPLPDIATTVATVPAGTAVLPGDNVSVTNTVKNVGPVPTSTAFVVGFALVPVDVSGNPTGSDIPLGVTRAAGPLGAGITSTATTPMMIPTGTAKGSYKIRVIGDLFGVVSEDTNLSNNNRLTNSFVVAIPNLTVNSVTFTPAASGAGMNVSFTHTLKNVAVAPGNAPASVSGIYLATSTSFSTVITQLGTVSAPALNANTTGGAITKSLTIPGVGVVPPGRYFVLVQANDDSGFVEASTANNVGASSTQLVLGPDLLVTAGSTPTGASPGMNISATYTVKNQGGMPAPVN